MKSIVETPLKKGPKPFPKLMLFPKTKLIILFDNPSVGSVVSMGESSYRVGYLSQAWQMHDLVDFDGSVTLSND